MPNPTDPFEMDEGVENIPVVQAPVQAVNKVANTAVKQTAAQIKATTKAFISQLYGVTDPASDTGQDATVDPQQQQQNVQKPVSQAQHHAGSTNQGQAAAQTVPSDQAKLEQTRRALQQTHTSEYFNPVIGDLETQIKREEQKRAQLKQQEEQEEEQEKVQMAELEEQKKNETPIAVQMARSKSERRPGAG